MKTMRKTETRVCNICGFPVAKGEKVESCPLCQKDVICESCKCDCQKEKVVEEQQETAPEGEVIDAEFKVIDESLTAEQLSEALSKANATELIVADEGLVEVQPTAEPETIEEKTPDPETEKETNAAPGETIKGDDGTVTAPREIKYFTTNEYLEAYDESTEAGSEEKLAEIGRIAMKIAKNKSEARRLRKELESSEEEYSDYLEERANKRGKPPEPSLYPEPESAAEKPKKERKKKEDASADDPTLTASAPVQTDDDDWWKSVLLSDLVRDHGLLAKTQVILAENQIETLGQLAAYTEPNSASVSKRFTDIKGIGPKKVENIEEATNRFWKSNGHRVKKQDSEQPTSESDIGKPAEPAAAIDGPTGEDAERILDQSSEMLPD